ncbi:MAG: hypothetical protein CVU55_02520 [Deltaproteobacteria bacterium HGW-Deltaproteobacteria-13]|jgi:hypothetical protein|nr:MAG: hypothetical protein CVU55_02520 [Deltaproteobacteria bacterium HGW-Deltaproteobacteria-13]
MSDVNVKKCSSCGEANEPDAAFCSNCGQRLTEDAHVKKCPSCGEANKPNAVFCGGCGNRFEEKKTQSAGAGSSIATQLMELSNEFLSVKEISPERFELSSQTGAQSPVQKIKIKYEAQALLNAETKLLTFWEKMTESSAGLDAGFSAEKTVQKGIDVNKKINGQILFGGKYGFEYGKLREVVKSIAGGQGWNFKTVIFKPKNNKDTAGNDSGKNIPVKKILLPVAALLITAILIGIGYRYFSGRPTQVPSSTKPQSTVRQNADEMQSTDRKVFQKQGSVAEGKPLIETDKNIYNHGEKIRVYYYNAPGSSRDWICIVRAGSRHTEPGDYQYIRRGRGVLIFKSPRPGEYEARAYYNYNSSQYKISARYGFTVR